MRITVAIGLGLALAANGLLMLFNPAGGTPLPRRAGDGPAQPGFRPRHRLRLLP